MGDDVSDDDGWVNSVRRVAGGEADERMSPPESGTLSWDVNVWLRASEDGEGRSSTRDPSPSEYPRARVFLAKMAVPVAPGDSFETGPMLCDKTLLRTSNPAAIRPGPDDTTRLICLGRDGETECETEGSHTEDTEESPS